MLNDFIGGGQIFLHKIRMLVQVLGRSFYTSLALSLVISLLLFAGKVSDYDRKAAWTYQKAVIVESFDDFGASIRNITNQKGKQRPTRIDAYTRHGLYDKAVLPYQILKNHYFATEYGRSVKFIKHILSVFALLQGGVFVLIFILWSRFGRSIKEEKQTSGAKIHNAKEVTKYLRSIGKAGTIKIGNMRLVKDSETRHIIVTGTTGSGKTNLINNILPQVILAKRPAVVIDQTGEMIAKYYDKGRGDIIFNPLDSRTHSWDFWTDNSNDIIGIGNDVNSRVEKFANVLFKYGKKPYSGGDPFWDNSAEIIFCECVQYLFRKNLRSITELQKMLGSIPLKQLEHRLAGTKASRYLNEANRITAGSILSVMATNAKPLSLLVDSRKKFSLKDYFVGIKHGSPAWLFLSSPPDLREVTMPLLACIFELAVSYLIGMGINQDRRLWFVIDELASLGRLNGFSSLMSEGRKYGGCVLAATQSISQLFENFGTHSGSSIFGQFATKFVFRTDEPSATKIITDIFGELEYRHQQKNTSFGANELRDGISYTEQQKARSLITTDMLASLADLECFVGLPEPKVRIARIKVPLVKVADKNPGFIQSTKDISIDIPDATREADIDADSNNDIDNPNNPFSNLAACKEISQEIPALEEADSSVTETKELSKENVEPNHLQKDSGLAPFLK